MITSLPGRFLRVSALAAGCFAKEDKLVSKTRKSGNRAALEFWFILSYLEELNFFRLFLFQCLALSFFFSLDSFDFGYRMFLTLSSSDLYSTFEVGRLLLELSKLALQTAHQVAGFNLALFRVESLQVLVFWTIKSHIMCTFRQPKPIDDS